MGKASGPTRWRARYRWSRKLSPTTRMRSNMPAVLSNSASHGVISSTSGSYAAFFSITSSAHFTLRSLLSAPAVVSQRMHKQIPAKLTCESFTEKPQFCLSLLGLLQNKSLIAGSPYKLYTYGGVFNLSNYRKPRSKRSRPAVRLCLRCRSSLLARNQSPNLFTLQRCPSLKGGQ